MPRSLAVNFSKKFSKMKKTPVQFIAQDFGLPTLEVDSLVDQDPSDEDRLRINPALGPMDSHLERYFQATREKKALSLLDEGWAKEPTEPETQRRPRLSLCMAAVSCPPKGVCRR
jgi:hypothetical protein